MQFGAETAFFVGRRQGFAKQLPADGAGAILATTLSHRRTAELVQTVACRHLFEKGKVRASYPRHVCSKHFDTQCRHGP